MEKAAVQTENELDFITRHSLRTLVKQGHPAALKMLGYKPAAVSACLSIETKEVRVGEKLIFSFAVTSVSEVAQVLLIDYILYFLKSERYTDSETFKITKRHNPAWRNPDITKIQLLRL